MPSVGETVTCAETGKSFVVAQEGCTYNYATNAAGEVFSDEGVDICEKRELLDRSRPFTGYISSDGRHFTGWKGNVLGHVVSAVVVPLPFGRTWDHWHGKNWTQYTIRDVHGGFWRGRSSPGIYIRLTPCKEPTK